MKTYRFNSETKEYLYAEEAFLDPLETEKTGKPIYLLPADSTFTEPLEAKEGYAAVWNGQAWEYVEDHRQTRDKGGVIVEGSGTPYWMPDDTWQTPARYMIELGSLPKDAIFTKPNKPIKLVRDEALSRIDSSAQSSILSGFDYEINGEILHFSYLAEDQQNFSDTFNGIAMKRLMGVDELPETIGWNGWRNPTTDSKGELVRLNLDIDSFLALYTKGALAHKSYHMTIHGQRKEAIETAESIEAINALLKEWRV